MFNTTRSAILGLSLIGVFSCSCSAAVDGVIAYLDPGTGAFIFQMLIAGIVGAGFAIKLFWHNIKNFFMKLFGAKGADPKKDEPTDK